MSELAAPVRPAPAADSAIPWPVFFVTVDRRLRGRPRPVDRERGLPVDRAVVPRGLDDDAVVGAVRLQRRVRRAAARRRAHRRPLGPAALVPAGRRRVHARLAAVRRGARAVDADRRPGRAGRRRRAADAGVARAAARRHPRRRSGRRPSPCGAASPPSPSPPARRSARCSSTPAAGGGRSSSTCPSPLVVGAGDAPRGDRVGRRRPAARPRRRRPDPVGGRRRSPSASPRATTGAGRAPRSLGAFAVAVGARRRPPCGGPGSHPAPAIDLQPVREPHRRPRQRGDGRLRRRLLRHAARQRAVPHRRCGSTRPSRPAWPSRPARWWWRRCRRSTGRLAAAHRLPAGARRRQPRVRRRRSCGACSSCRHRAGLPRPLAAGQPAHRRSAWPSPSRCSARPRWPACRPSASASAAPSTRPPARSARCSASPRCGHPRPARLAGRRARRLPAGLADDVVGRASCRRSSRPGSARVDAVRGARPGDGGGR